MANRYGRDIGRRDRGQSGGGDYGRRSFGSGSRPFGDDERYFGGSRRYGEGYTGQSYRDFDTTEDRGFGSYGGGYGSDYTESESSEDYGTGYQGGRHRQGNEYSQGWGGEADRLGYGGSTGRGYSGRGSSGNFHGSSGSGYSGRDTSGYGNYGSTRYGDRWAGQGGEDIGRYRSGYGSGYPSSERGYMDEADDRGWWDRASDEVASWFGDEEASRRRRMDARGGGHRGRGPTGYSRSDDRIKEDINDRLTDYDYIDATNINVEVNTGDVTLTGTVDTRYEKRLAEDIAEDVSGVKNVENRLRVSSTTSSFGQTGSTGYQSTTSGSTDTGTTTTGTQAKGKSSGT